MPHTPLLRSLVRLFRDHRTARAAGLTPAQVRDERAARAVREPRLTRRGFLAGSAAVAAGALIPWKLGCSSEPVGSKGKSRIAVVGAGIAGLSAALRLADAGVACTIYEASPETVGGRMLTDAGSAKACGTCHAPKLIREDVPWEHGQVTDIFGELVDTNHETLIGLCERFQIPLVDMLGAQPAGSTETYYFNGQHYSKADADRDFAAVFTKLEQDLADFEEESDWDTITPAGKALDSLTMYDWIESRVPGGHGSAMGALLDVAYVIEYGADSRDQSALNLIWMLAYSDPAELQVFGESDERFSISGGVNRLPQAIAAHLGADAIQLGWVLESLARKSDGSYTLAFMTANGSRTVEADIVLLALPFHSLKTVDLSQAGFDARKQKAIAELGAGKNGKMNLQFSSRLWAGAGVWGIGNGSSYADTGYQATWEATRGVPGTGGILVHYTGGSVVDTWSLAHPYGNAADPAVVQDAQRFLTQIEPVYPGISALWNGKVTASKAHLSPWLNGSYAFYKPGQYQAFSGYEGVRQGNVFFAGDHCSSDWQGFMEGGAAEGLRAGADILESL
ncbi:MAG: NAD(P)/FAD-dependent oxidoreductase [Myxococcota bacterium]|jgi:monoamine oxidase|nr:NAD(P)/FAD-dependent oxidoreductase [Myxococcota bacterium]